MAKRTGAVRKSRGRNSSRRTGSSRKSQADTEEVIKAAEKMAMAALSSGLKLVAAFGAAAAKSASLALESLASGADRFSDLVRKETLRLPNGASSSLEGLSTRSVRKTSRRKKRVIR